MAREDLGSTNRYALLDRRTAYRRGAVLAIACTLTFATVACGGDEESVRPQEWDLQSLEPHVGEQIFVGDSFEVGGNVPKMFDAEGNELDVVFSISLEGEGLDYEIVSRTVEAGSNRAKCFTWQTSTAVEHEDGTVKPMAAGSYVVEYRAHNPQDLAAQTVGGREIVVQEGGL